MYLSRVAQKLKQKQTDSDLGSWAKKGYLPIPLYYGFHSATYNLNQTFVAIAPCI